jgi:hypothetical protein
MEVGVAGEVWIGRIDDGSRGRRREDEVWGCNLMLIGARWSPVWYRAAA